MSEKNRQGASSFGIVDTNTVSAPLGADYVGNLFTSDPNDISPIGQADTLKEEDKKDDGPVTPFIDSDDDFIDNLGKKKVKKPVVQDEEDDEEDEEEKQVETRQKKKQSKKEPEPEEDEEEEDSDEEDETDEDKSASNNIIPDFSKELFQMGLFTLDDDEDEIPVLSTPKDLVDRFRYENRKGSVEILENILSQYGEDYREAFDAIFVNGVSPKDYFGHIERINNLATLDMSIQENQKMIAKHYLETVMGLDQNRASAKIQRMVDNGDLEDESKDFHKFLVAKEQSELEHKEENKKRENFIKARQEQEFQSAVNKILSDKLKAREFDGIPVDEKLARDTASYMLEKKWQLRDGRQISDFEKEIMDLELPQNRELKAKVAVLFQLMKQDPQFSRLQRKAVAKETNEMFKSLQRERSTLKKQGKKQTNFFDD